LQASTGHLDRPSVDAAVTSRAAAHAHVGALTHYSQEIRRLVNDDFTEVLVATRRIPSLTAPMLQRLKLAADCEPVKASDDAVKLARRLAWGALLPGTGLQTLVARYPGRGAVWAAHAREVLRGAGMLGRPWRLAAYTLEVLRRRPSAAAPMLEAHERLEHLAQRVRWDPEAIDALRYRHLEMQVASARAVRESELVDPECLASLELTGAVLLMRAAGTRDLARAWTAGRGDGNAVASALLDVDRAGALQAEQALRAIFRPPDPTWVAALSAADRDALRFAQAVGELPPGSERALLFEPLSDPQMEIWA
jgi:hypothetical protein